MRMERSKDNRVRGVPGSHTYVGKHPAQNERFGLYGVFERKKCIADIPEVGKYEVCVPKQRILVYYVDTAGKNTKAIKEYIANQLKQDRESDQLSLFDPQDPFMGNK